MTLIEHTISHINAVLSITPARWLSLVSALPTGLLTRPPASGEWSAAECLMHVVDTEKMVFPPRIQAFLNGQNFSAFNPATQGQKLLDFHSLVALANDLAHLRAANLQLLNRITELDLPRVARHGELGRVTLGELLYEWAAHDLMHLVQAEQALMQPFIEECGPWRRYFMDHDVKARSPSHVKSWGLN